MKNKFLLVGILAITLVATGCNKNLKEDNVLNCSMKGTVVEGVETNSSYKVTHDGKYVELIETEEIVISTNKEYLETVKTTVESMYSPYNDVEYYEYNVTLNGDTLTSITKIDYSKIDMDELSKINSAMAAYMEDGKLKVSTVENLYNQMGITCK